MKIEVKNLEKKFKKIVVLHDINYTFTEGKIYGLIGRNGSGKSVFLKLLCGFYAPTKGEILYDGVNIIKERLYPPSTRALIENPSFIPDISGLENLKQLAAIQKKIDEKTMIEISKKLNLEQDLKKKYKTYSLGMKQKLGIIQVLMEDPKVMILDEPFNGIENKTVSVLREILKEEKAKGKIILLSSHIKEDIEQLADEVIEFDDGTIHPYQI